MTGQVVIQARQTVVEVAAAIIERPDGSFLLARRPVGKVYAGYWEFPGGKVESGESAHAALVRELHEELGIEVTESFPWITRVFVYDHATVRLNFFRVTGWRGDPVPREAQIFSWQLPGEVAVGPMLPANEPVLDALELPLVYAITDASTMGEAEQLLRLNIALPRGLRLIQVREKHMSATQLERFVSRVLDAARKYGARVLVNADPALAVRTGAHGVHFSSAQLATLRERPDGLLSAASCHSGPELEKAEMLGLDFAVLGPVRATATHPEATPIGWEGFARITHGTCIPVFALGGLVSEDSGRARLAGAHGIAMIRGAWR